MTGIKSLGVVNAAEDPNASEYLQVDVDVEESLEGDAGPQVTFAWEAYVTDGNGEP